ncbi:stage II sporulation protein D [Halobacillus alkaliphilus]|uniref:Stage II sporulation protein D n=1 Tax=Halobacillus alkaliphilus TaxID=396056 RepID=A0A1I2LGB1_9BACI|nr:stage II sporulation protein D [Halobacillus alkaliphilus]SFF76497.1 stage II sporulation protein D [Halobacillus alkaliphilus]
MKRKNWMAFFITGGLFGAILILPTLIVVPFTGSSASHEVQETPNPIEKAADSSKDLSPIAVRVERSQSGKIEEVPLETYVARVVASEMPAEFELEALKAQALAARTYITRHLLEDEAVSQEADVTDTVNHQVYKNDEELRAQWHDQYTSNMEKINTAVNETAGEIITYNQEPITAAFFSTSNGYTENAEDYWENEIPYLKSVESPWDQQSPKFADQKIIPISQVQTALGINFKGNVQNMTMTKTEGNRVDKVQVGDQTFSGRQIRETFELPSSDFSMQQKGDHVIFTTKGYGHGVGMSQYGANGMAKSGSSYKDIVTHYYHDTEVSSINKQTALLTSKNDKPVN